MKIQFFQPTIWRAGVHASPPATPPSSQALDLRLAKHDLWINHIPFTLHYPSATRGGATCYLIKGGLSLPPTKSTESWQIPLADLSSNWTVWVIHPLTDTGYQSQESRWGSASAAVGTHGSMLAKRLCSPGQMMSQADPIVGRLTLHQK